ncbi:hypothetical protein FTN78_p100012 (plasmid) [Lactococcus lactis subsp. lactis bv. diacetylactis]|nr:hypothetical protein FTN78_p100012 [Lactococcus lactis subsp. lactis bv. diacetylactis]
MSKSAFFVFLTNCLQKRLYLLFLYPFGKYIQNDFKIA